MDKLLIDKCSKIVTDHARCAILQHSVVGGEPSEADAHEIYATAAGGRADMAWVEETKATTLAGCYAKARVLSVIADDYIALSLAADILLILNADGSLRPSSGGPTGASFGHDIA